MATISTLAPAVFTKENDLSFLPKGIADIGAAFVGPFLKGPAFRPVILNSRTDLQQKMGDLTPDFYTPYAVNEYLKEAPSATVVRVLGLDGYDYNVVKPQVIKATSGSVTSVVAVVHPTCTGVQITSASISGTLNNFTLTMTSSVGNAVVFANLSANPTSPTYISNVLGTSAKGSQIGYVHVAFPAVSGLVGASASVSMNAATTELNLSGSAYGSYSNAVTPWIRSQAIGGKRFNLFRAWTTSDGTYANTDTKVSIANIRPGSLPTDFGTFSLLVRAFSDTDTKMTVLEQFDNLTLDDTAPNYVARVIGTSRILQDANGDIYTDGDFPNNSSYIYIETAAGLENISNVALPLGFAPLAPTVNAPNVPAPTYVASRYYTPSGSSVAINNDKVYYGFTTQDLTSVAFLAPIPSGSSTITAVLPTGASDVGFDLLSTVTSSNDQTDLALTNTLGTAYRKFTVPFQGGFDGQNPAVIRNTGAAINSTNTMGFDLSDVTKAGTRAYVAALKALSNPQAYDINLLVTPGVIYSQHPYVASQAIQLCETRADCFYVMDSDINGATVQSAVGSVAGIDSNYAATYHPWEKILDVTNNKTVWVPPSVLIPSVYAFNDRIAAEWYAPAGLLRGGIGQALQVRSRLQTGDLDSLYAGRVNPIVLFPGQGVTVWGQKTLQHNASALDRINVRRLLIAVKKFVASAALYLVFEQNVDATRKRFLSIVNPYLSSVAERNGLYAFKVIMDDSNNTADSIDRGILNGQLLLQPARTVEYVQLTFSILPTGASFAE